MSPVEQDELKNNKITLFFNVRVYIILIDFSMFGVSAACYSAFCWVGGVCVTVQVRIANNLQNNLPILKKFQIGYYESVSRLWIPYNAWLSERKGVSRAVASDGR